MKVVKSAQHYTETAVDEIKLLRCVRIYPSSVWFFCKNIKTLSFFQFSGLSSRYFISLEYSLCKLPFVLPLSNFLATISHVGHSGALLSSVL